MCFDILKPVEEILFGSLAFNVFSTKRLRCPNWVFQSTETMYLSYIF